VATVAFQLVASVAISYGMSYLSSKLAKPTNAESGKLATIDVTTGAEGSSIVRLYGMSKVAAQLIWCTKFKETKSTTTQGGGKGSGGSKSTTTTYTYSVSCAMAFCEGSNDVQLSRLWIDDKEVSIAALPVTSFTFYTGDETQNVDSTISAVETVENTPAFRGVCYAVFENLQLADYGNRIPNICAELVKPIS